MSNALQASDALYFTPGASATPAQSSAFANLDPKQQALVKQPAQTSNDFLNYAVLITPTAYSPAQHESAVNFVKIAAQSTKNLANGLNLSNIGNNPGVLSKVKNSKAYQTFQYTLHTLLAIRSMSINTLNQLIAERTPMLGLGAAAGLPANQPASPLQVEAYQANHRIQNPNWYAHIKLETPATLQRETLVVLAEIEHQNYEAHLDNERLLSAMTAANLQTAMTAVNSTLSMQENGVNEVISSANSSSSAPSTQQTVTPPTPGAGQ